MRPVHHLHPLLRLVFVHHLHPLLVDDWHYLLLSLSAGGFVVQVQSLPSLAFVQNRLRQLGHQIVHLDEPGQQRMLLTVPLELLYLLRRRMIWHLSLLALRHQLSLRDLVLQLPDLGFQLLDHPLLVLRRGFLRRVLEPNFHQHYLLSIPVHH